MEPMKIKRTYTLVLILLPCCMVECKTYNGVEAVMAAKEFVKYSDFGAVGDGKTDDMDAIAKAHAHANEQGLPVKADDNATYYIDDQELHDGAYGDQCDWFGQSPR